MPDAGFLTFVLNMVKLGGLGVGALIFVLAFIVLIRNQPADAGMADFRGNFLRWGAAFAVVALLVSLVTDYLNRPMAPAGKVQLGVTISPDFAEAKLPQPEIRLMPQGTLVPPNGSVDVSGPSTLAIEVRGIVQSVNDLAQSSTQLLTANQKLTAAIDQSSAAVATAQGSASGTPTPGKTPVAASQIPVLQPDELAGIKAAQSQMLDHLRSGDFHAAVATSAKLRSLAVPRLSPAFAIPPAHQ